jgi:hypothetical protein
MEAKETTTAIAPINAAETPTESFSFAIDEKFYQLENHCPSCKAAEKINVS